MPKFLINKPKNWNEIKKFIQTTLNKTYKKQPRKIIFLCGDAHPPGGGVGDSLDICNNLAKMIINGDFSPYSSQRMSRVKLSLHLESNNYPDDIQISLKGNSIENLNELGLKNTNIFGWEPIGFGDYNKISSLMELENLSDKQMSEAGILLNKSNRYFASISQNWSHDIIKALNNLALTLNDGVDQRTAASLTYGNTLLAQRINANMALAQGMSLSLKKVDNLFVHFISVGNAHIVEGDTIINGIDILEASDCVGFSIGRF